MAKIKKEDLTQEIVKQLITYDPTTGVIIRNYLSDDMQQYFHSKRFFDEWNDKAGTEMKRINIHKKRCNYKQINIALFGFTVIGARLIWLYMTGDWPKNHIDHINGNSLDNRWTNLRDVTPTENLRNQKIRKNNTSGRTGVSFLNCRGKWQATASTSVNGKRKRLHLGLYEDFEDAVKAREEWEKEQGDFTTRHTQVSQPRGSQNCNRPLP